MFMFSGFDHGQLSYEAMILSSVAYSGSEDSSSEVTPRSSGEQDTLRSAPTNTDLT